MTDLPLSQPASTVEYGAPRGAINAWQCDACHLYLVAIHVDQGVTPMFLACRATAECRGKMVSNGYPPGIVPGYIVARLAWEWRKASTTQLKQWKRDRDPMLDHATRGGLILHALSEAGRIAALELLPAEPTTQGDTHVQDRHDAS